MKKIAGKLSEFISGVCSEIRESTHGTPLFIEDIVIEAKIYPVIEYLKKENGTEEPRLSVIVPRIKEELNYNTFSSVRVKFNVLPS